VRFAATSLCKLDQQLFELPDLEFCQQLDRTDPKVSCTPITQFEQLSNAHKIAEMMKVSLRGEKPYHL
jgi:hypothetical protein